MRNIKFILPILLIICSATFSLLSCQSENSENNAEKLENDTNYTVNKFKDHVEIICKNDSLANNELESELCIEDFFPEDSSAHEKYIEIKHTGYTVKLAGHDDVEYNYLNSNYEINKELCKKTGIDFPRMRLVWRCEWSGSNQYISQKYVMERSLTSSEIKQIENKLGKNRGRSLMEDGGWSISDSEGYLSTFDVWENDTIYMFEGGSE